ncbi:MAG: hypothetical protein NTW21_18630 [Verrucomicrobia bacterium]|nr:hypothetical protein [Verrucomicrobiota bacterium]
MNRSSFQRTFSSVLALGLAITPAIAQNANYAPGDLVLFFQQEGGAKTVYANLGNAATVFRGAAAGPDAANKVNFLNIGTELTSAFGAGWPSDPSIYAGLAGVWGTSTSSNVLQDGDPHRTLYVSSPRNSVGTVGQANSAAWDFSSAAIAMSAGATNISSQNNRLETLYATAVAVSPTADSMIDDQNPFLTTGIQGTAFGAFEGGVQQVGTAGTFGTFGAAGSVEFALDLYRILAKHTITSQVAGALRIGSYEGTVTVNSSGQVSFIAQGAAASAYDTWIGTFISLTAPADKLPTADPDDDGATNLEEFGFGGDPTHAANRGVRLIRTVDADGDSEPDLTLTLEVRSGATFTAVDGDLAATSIDGITYRIEGSTDLVNWDSPVSEVNALGVGSPSAGYVFKTFRLNAGNGLHGKGFLRASVAQP